MITIKNAWTVFTQNKQKVVYAAILEFIFLIAIAQIHLFFFMPTADAAATAAQIITEEVAKLPATELAGLDSVLTGNEQFTAAYNTLIKNIFYFLFSLLIAWIVMKGPAWFFGLKSVHKKLKFTQFAQKFTLLSIFWFIIFLGFLLLMTTAIKYASSSVLPLVGEGATQFLLWVLLLIIIYFAHVSFSLIPATQTFKKTFYISIQQAKRLIPVFVVNAIAVALSFALALVVGKSYVLAVLPITVFITIPVIILARIHIVFAVHKCLRKHS